MAIAFNTAVVAPILLMFETLASQVLASENGRPVRTATLAAS
jgi:hypothetical protein